MWSWIKEKLIGVYLGGYIGQLLRTLAKIGVTALVASGKLKQSEADSFLAALDPVAQAAIALLLLQLFSVLARFQLNHKVAVIKTVAIEANDKLVENQIKPVSLKEVIKVS